jgi:hypothetical protein
LVPKQRGLPPFGIGTRRNRGTQRGTTRHTRLLAVRLRFPLRIAFLKRSDSNQGEFR